MTNSRGGCSNCKRRKKKCDQQRPWCAACRHRGLQCSGYSTKLRWVEVPGAQEVSSNAVDTQMTAPDIPEPVSDLTTELLFHKFLYNGLTELYNTTTSSWIQPFLMELSAQSKSLPAVSAAIQVYLDGGGGDLPVSSMEFLDVALKTFRAELADSQGTFHPAIACAGLLLCVLNVIPPSMSRVGVPHVIRRLVQSWIPDVFARRKR
ncbi:hypothetical protein ACHAPI_010390 [Fusarium lateritium]